MGNVHIRSGARWPASLVAPAFEDGLAGVRPQLLLDVPDSGGVDGLGLEEFDVAPDGRFLMLKGLPESPAIPHVIVNWFGVLKQTAAASSGGAK